VYSHCQIPCGIYDDAARFKMLSEHITTIEKSMTSINQLSSQAKPDYNQIVRWIDNKEKHADEASEIITYYFMAQRLKSIAVKKSKEYENYVSELTMLHEMLVEFMKSKQSTDQAVVKNLRRLRDKFEKQYFENRK